MLRDPSPRLSSTGVLRLAFIAATLTGCSPPSTLPRTTAGPDAGRPAADVATGKQIYFRGSGHPSRQIMAQLGQPPVTVPAGTLPCVNCHGRDGLGRPEGGLEPSDIRWRFLTTDEKTRGRSRAAYNEALFRRAVTMGLDPAGRALDPGMPRYQLTHEDLDSLVAYLKTMESDLDPGLTDTTIRLGLVLAPRSQAESLGEPVRKALMTFFDLVDERGGVYGRRVELSVVEAPEAPAERVAALARFLDEARPFALVSPYMAEVEAQFAALAGERSIPVVGPLTRSPAPGDPPARLIFYLNGGLAGELRALAGFAGALGKGRKAATIYRAGPVASLAVPVLREACDRTGLGRPEEAAAPETEAGWNRSIQELRSRGVSVVFAVGLRDETRSLLEAAEAAGWCPDVLTPASLAGRATIKSPPQFGGRVYLSLPTPPTLQEAAAREYGELVQRGHLDRGHEAAQWAALGAAKLMVEGLNRSGRTLSRDRLIEVLEEVREFDTGYSPPVSFAPGRRIGADSPAIVALELPAGRLVPVADPGRAGPGAPR
jgi:ABC-type branched-subunit amino acid transport system substrate-binding protein